MGIVPRFVEESKVEILLAIRENAIAASYLSKAIYTSTKYLEQLLVEACVHR
jgi:hypothetical protein